MQTEIDAAGFWAHTRRIMAKANSQKPSNGSALDFEAQLWAAADKMRGHMDASEYKHICLGLIFLKYISDAFKEKREQLLFGFSDPKSKDVLGRVYEYEKFASAEGTLQLAKSSRSNRRKSDRAQAPPPGKWRG